MHVDETEAPLLGLPEPGREREDGDIAFGAVEVGQAPLFLNGQKPIVGYGRTLLLDSDGTRRVRRQELAVDAVLEEAAQQVQRVLLR